MVGRSRLVEKFREMDFDSVRGTSGGSLIKFRSFDSIGKCSSGMWGRCVIRGKGFSIS